ncbi:hypothetical protein JCM3774_006862 [Rhodotorula dairenensis]
MLAKFAQGVLDAVSSATTAVATAAAVAGTPTVAAPAEATDQQEAQVHSEMRSADDEGAEADPADPVDAEEDDGRTTTPGGSFSVAPARRTTRSGRACSQDLLKQAEGGEEEEEEEDPSRGKDGKEYLVAGLYYSATTAAYAASLDTGPSSSFSRTRTRTNQPLHRRDHTHDNNNSSSSGRWREIEPSKQTAFPPPVFYGETLLEPPEDADSDDADEAKGACRPFRLPFDILRDHWYPLLFDQDDRRRSSTGDGGAARKQRRGKLRSTSDPVHIAAGQDDVRQRRSGKGGDKTTEEDIIKREQSKKPPPYRYISKNVYFGRGPDKAAIPAVCMCRPPTRATEMGCGRDCINRMMQYCCEPKLCPCGPDRCGNLPLSKREGVPVAKDGLVVIWTGNRGFGLKTMRPIKKGEFVVEYRGEIISRDESYRRVLTDYKDSASYYFMDYDGFEVVDAGQRGNCARFINHSCGPNLEVVRWRLAQLEEYQMGLFALHDIPVGTELTYDYGWQDFSALAPKSSSSAAVSSSSASPAVADTDASSTPITATTEVASPAEAIVLGNGTAIDPSRQRCYCGAAECSGFLGGRKKPTTRAPKSVAAAAADSKSAKAKGKRKAQDEPVGACGGDKTTGRLGSQGQGPDGTVAPSPRLAFAQAKIRVVDPDQAQGTDSPAQQPPAKKKARSSSSSSSSSSRDAEHERGRALEHERNRVIGAMRSGRDAARRAAGKLVGSLAPATSRRT